MSKTIDYFASLQSPWTYLGHQRLVEIAARHGATIRIAPVNFGVIFPKTGGLPLPKRAPERQTYRMMELRRWRSFLDVPLNFTPAHFPTDETLAAGMVAAARDAGQDAVGLAGAVLRGVWAEEKDIADRDTLLAIADGLGLDGSALVSAAETDAGATWQRDTEAALERGVFGAPTYIYRDELFWGQDRIDFLDRAVGG
ncbi:MAG: 2-hydroxychromene-2-carboxylate isomerase [Minwuiales bacterium]|nr:2-hydroxychromene-2-carboxylate isomerase [Minwuiales bacterium]